MRRARHPLVRALAALSFENCFNPYSDRCATFDRADAVARRAALLSSVLTRAETSGVDSLWLGRDLGHRGGRRTGLALTDDIHLERHAARFGLEARSATKGPPIAEHTAAHVWRALEAIDAPVFLWNVFPLHPHEPGAPFTNRPHRAIERKAGEEILEALILLLRPRRVVALGADAATAAKRIAPSLDLHAVRHPSYGGQAQFARDVADARESDEPSRRTT
jgi:uracil-DNA glycosylase